MNKRLREIIHNILIIGTAIFVPPATYVGSQAVFHNLEGQVITQIERNLGPDAARHRAKVVLDDTDNLVEKVLFYGARKQAQDYIKYE